MENDISWPARILEYIKVNRVSSTQVADALYKTGELDPKLKVLVPGSRAVGFIHYVPAVNGSNWYTHKYLRDTPKDSVVYVEGTNCNGLAIFGSLVSKFVIIYRQASGIVVSGLLRDVHQLIKERYPIWCYGTTPIGCVNEETGFNEYAFEERKRQMDGSLIVADDTGVVLIKRKQLTEDLYHRLEFIEEQEDIWFDCIDRLKWNTFDTVCLKKYKEINSNTN
ncbi:MAG: bifunctional hexulose-6-phosphate synthase/ribonuclease regulator [Pelotomaculum sp. PtaB.Bin104]|nr:MAG: bifunctional hexulose-6-phosphate synthase/ribonuclease regulator [Pelotomaculum sp. PtaB.Bin104]